MRRMNPKPDVQSEANQKEKNKYGILRHICIIWKNSHDEPIFREGIETSRRDLWTQQGKKREGQMRKQH